MREQAAAKNADIPVSPVSQETTAQCSDCVQVDLKNNKAVEKAIRRSDVVVIGKVTRNISTLTPNASFVFTDSELVVDEMLKSGNALRTGDEITVVSPGGRVKIDGHRVEVRPAERNQFLVGHSYLLFLRFLPESQSYVYEGIDGFDVTGPVTLPIHKNLVSPGESLLGNTVAFVAAMRTAVLESNRGGAK